MAAFPPGPTQQNRMMPSWHRQRSPNGPPCRTKTSTLENETASPPPTSYTPAPGAPAPRGTITPPPPHEHPTTAQSCRTNPPPPRSAPPTLFLLLTALKCVPRFHTPPAPLPEPAFCHHTHLHQAETAATLPGRAYSRKQEGHHQRAQSTTTPRNRPDRRGTRNPQKHTPARVGWPEKPDRK